MHSSKPHARIQTWISAAKAGNHLLSSIWVRCGPKDHLLDLADRQPTERADHDVLNKLHDCEKPYKYTCKFWS